MPTVVALWSVAALLVTAAMALPTARARAAGNLVYGAALAASLVLCGVALAVLLGLVEPPQELTLALGVPWIGAHFRIDALAAFFLAVVNFGGAAASFYALGYGRHESAPHRVLPFFPLFLAGMNLVVLAADAFTFLLAWEVMSLASWALVMAHHREEGNRRAGYVYIVMASFGTLALLLAFGLLAGASGGYAFADIRAAAHPSGTAALVFILVLVGAGSKAGLVPLHVWLPLAHPAAPSHVSALMSGVMTKVALYGLIRVVFDLLGAPSPWWAIVFLVVGGATVVVGVVFALMERDLKRLLAYSTVENVGVIAIGLGLALAFQAGGMPGAAALALTAALLHVFNHSLFKSLLFFGAGTVLTATGHRDLDRLGGLVHRLPLTAIVFLVGCIAISALPPLNGFVSEWLTFQAMLISPDLPDWGLKLLVPAVAAVLALAAALAGATFAKAFGIGFLGRPRSPEAAAATEADRFSVGAMGILAGLCLLAGIFPTFLIEAAAPVVDALVGARLPTADGAFAIVPIAEGRSSYNGLLVLLFVGAAGLIAAFVIHRLASRTVRRAPAWDCGYPDPSPSTQYSAVSFAEPVRRVFGTALLRAREQVDMPPPGSTEPAILRVTTQDVLWSTLYAPVAAAVGTVADVLNRMQFLTVRRYLFLVFGALVALLIVLAIWQ